MGYDLRDHVVFITGASGGIGRACAVEYHRAGSRVVVTARSYDKLVELADELGRDRVLPIKLDVTIPEQRDTALLRTRDHFGGIDVMVNNAGWASFASVIKTPQEHIDRMLSLNLAAPIAMIQAVVPDMIARGSGQIVNISSVVGHQAIPRMTVYSATKSALTALSTGLRMELKGTGVDVILVSPGSTRSDFFDAAATVDVKTARFSKTQYSPQRVARAVVRSSRTRRREVTLTIDGKTIVLIRRFSHRLADGIMNMVAKYGMPEK